MGECSKVLVCDAVTDEPIDGFECPPITVNGESIGESGPFVCKYHGRIQFRFLDADQLYKYLQQKFD